MPPRRFASGLLVTMYEKDRFKSSFIGRVHFNLFDLFDETTAAPIAFHDPENQVSLHLHFAILMTCFISDG